MSSVVTDEIAFPTDCSCILTRVGKKLEGGSRGINKQNKHNWKVDGGGERGVGGK